MKLLLHPLPFNTANANYKFHNPANEFCGGLLDGSKANDTSVYASHNLIEIGQVNKMDLGGVLNLVLPMKKHLRCTWCRKR